MANHNLEGDAVDRDVFVFLAPIYDKQTRPHPVADALHGYSIGVNNGLTGSMYRKRIVFRNTEHFSLVEISVFKQVANKKAEYLPEKR